jgi:geranylgeranyl diphosphate synthase type I
VTLTILHHLQSRIIAQLLAGEALDIEFSLLQDPLSESINAQKILDMLWLKTGVLYEFAGRAGAMIGKNTSQLDEPQVEAIASFAGQCGIAFQLQDDIIGLIGDEADTGKPVGSDIREGKLTLILYDAYQKASERERAAIRATVGNRGASPTEVKSVTNLLRDLGGVERVANEATAHIQVALPMLDAIADSGSKLMLQSWAEFMIDRKF